MRKMNLWEDDSLGRSPFRTNFFTEKDVKMLNDVVYWNCNELDVKDILV